MTLEEARNHLAAALQHASAEHGRPNSFAPGELATFYGGPPARLAGRIGARYMRSLWEALGGSKKWGSCPVYADRRFFV